jgi:hypothetical protein
VKKLREEIGAVQMLMRRFGNIFLPDSRMQ